MQRNKSEFIVSALLLAIFAVIGANAGGPLEMWNKEQRIPYRWDVTTPVSVYTDNGPFEIIAPQYTPIPNETADAAVAFSIGQWSNVETSSFNAQVVGDFASIGLPDITSANAGEVIGPDNGGGVHVIYDADGKVLKNFFGAPSNVLGIAGPEWADETTGTITEGWVVLNAQSRWVGDDNLQNFAAVITHEFGHAINLAHSQTNGAINFSSDARGPASCSTLPYSATSFSINNIETMHPFLNVKPSTGIGIQMSTIDVSDDKASVSNLYPAAGYPTTHGSITGRILQTNGNDGITGVNVIARNLDDPYADAVSAMSGDYVRVQTNNDGTYTLNGLTPGARYAVYTDMIVSGGFPTKQPDFMPEGEEFYNGANESGNGLTDDRCQMEPITAVAGTTTTADIALNSVKGAPKFVPMIAGVAPNAISRDGSVIGGSIVGGGTFRYTEADGPLALNTVKNAISQMSSDGTAFSSQTLTSSNIRIASLLFYPGGAWHQLPVPQPAPPATLSPSDQITGTNGVADGGKAVAGLVYVDTNGPLPGQGGRARPFIWTPEGGSTILPVPANTGNARPNSISADGSTLVGWYDQAAGGLRHGGRWVNGEFASFSTPEFYVGEATRTTTDGSIIVGMNAGPQREAWSWTEQGGIKMLGRLGALSNSYGMAVSEDGQVIAGFGGSVAALPGDLSGNRAFLWTPELGFVDLENFLKAQGTSFEGWILNAPHAATADGTKLIGLGLSPRGEAGWILQLDTVNICHAPPGNPRNTHTINVPFRRDMGDHLKHGDTIGVCTDSQ